VFWSDILWLRADGQMGHLLWFCGSFSDKSILTVDKPNTSRSSISFRKLGLLILLVQLWPTVSWRLTSFSPLPFSHVLEIHPEQIVSAGWCRGRGVCCARIIISLYLCWCWVGVAHRVMSTISTRFTVNLTVSVALICTTLSFAPQTEQQCIYEM